MTIKRRYLPPMLLAVAAAASIATAPAALAEQSCTYLSANSTVCQTPGNVQSSTRRPRWSTPRSFPTSAVTCSSSTMAAMADIARTLRTLGDGRAQPSSPATRPSATARCAGSACRRSWCAIRSMPVDGAPSPTVVLPLQWGSDSARPDPKALWAIPVRGATTPTQLWRLAWRTGCRDLQPAFKVLLQRRWPKERAVSRSIYL